MASPARVASTAIAWLPPDDRPSFIHSTVYRQRYTAQARTWTFRRVMKKTAETQVLVGTETDMRLLPPRVGPLHYSAL